MSQWCGRALLWEQKVKIVVQENEDNKLGRRVGSGGKIRGLSRGRLKGEPQKVTRAVLPSLSESFWPHGQKGALLRASWGSGCKRHPRPSGALVTFYRSSVPKPADLTISRFQHLRHNCIILVGPGYGYVTTSSCSSEFLADHHLGCKYFPIIHFFSPVRWYNKSPYLMK